MRSYNHPLRITHHASRITNYLNSNMKCTIILIYRRKIYFFRFLLAFNNQRWLLSAYSFIKKKGVWANPFVN